MIKRFFLIAVLLISALIFCADEDYEPDFNYGDQVKVSAVGGLLDINAAPLEDFYILPIGSELALNIYNFREFHSYFDSYYDLMKVKGMDAETFKQLKNLIYVRKFAETDLTTQRLNSLYYILSRQSDEEGIQEGVTDEWTDVLLSPFNINRGIYTQFLNMPNVSPVDAYAISMKLRDSGGISSVRSLRDIQGLSSYGYRNLRNYVSYTDAEYDNKIHCYAQLYFDNSPYTEDDEDKFASLVQKYLNLGADFLSNYMNTNPAMMLKFRMRKDLKKFGKEIKLGGLLSKQYGDDFPITRTSKLFAEYRLNDFNKIIIGDYRLTLGHGIIMENSDYFSPRKTGFGFSKRITGIIGDTSRTEEFRLRGVAGEFHTGGMTAVAFYSDDDKDAVLNDDGSVQSLIVNKPALSNESLEILNDLSITNTNTWMTTTPIPDARDVLNEKTYGGQLKYEFFPGNYIAFTGYSSEYDKYFHPLSRTEFVKNIDPNYYADWEEDMAYIINNEYFYLYDNTGESSSKRTVLGGEFAFNFANVNLSGEYGKLLGGGDALLLTSYIQFNSLNLLVLYRDIDVDYDNPYARPFAENKRYNDTFFEKYNYQLANPLNGDLYFQSPYSQPERGVYFETRYQFARNLTLTRAYIDLFQRKADGRPTMRFQGELEYRPIFPVRINVKQKFLWNKMDNSDARSISNSAETTLRFRANLSNYDSLGFECFFTSVNLPPYPYLSNNAESNIDNLAVGTGKMLGSAYTVSYRRNFTKTLEMQMDYTLWDTEQSSVWDWEDTRIDFMSRKGHKVWFVITNWLSANINLKLKFWYKSYVPQEHYVRTWWNDALDDPTDYTDYEAGKYPYLSNVTKTQTAVRLHITFLY